MELATQDQILVIAVCISLQAFGKVMNPTVSSPS